MTSTSAASTLPLSDNFSEEAVVSGESAAPPRLLPYPINPAGAAAGRPPEARKSFLASAAGENADPFEVEEEEVRFAIEYFDTLGELLTDCGLNSSDVDLIISEDDDDEEGRG